MSTTRLRALRLATHRRRGPGTMRPGRPGYPSPYALHCRTLGLDAPFVVCDPNVAGNGIASVRSPANRGKSGSGRHWRQQPGGSLCVRRFRGYHLMFLSCWRGSTSPSPCARLQLIVLREREQTIAYFSAGPSPIRISPLRGACGGATENRLKSTPTRLSPRLNAPANVFSRTPISGGVIECAAKIALRRSKKKSYPCAWSRSRVSTNDVTQAAETARDGADLPHETGSSAVCSHRRHLLEQYTGRE